MAITTRAVTILALTVTAIPSIATGQVRASERGTVSQEVDGTKITLDYGRPRVRGRDSLFGGEVWWGKVWTPGANWATNIEVSRDVTIDGHGLPQGKYSVWFHVQEEGWTAIFDPEPRRFHLMPPEMSDEQVRFSIEPAEGPFVEMLSWSFPAVRPTGATLEMAWGSTHVSFDIGVQPSRPVTVAADLAQRYVGTYSLALGPQLGGDTVQFDVTHDDEGHLVGHWENAPNPRLGEVWLVYLGEGMFAPGELEAGELFDIVVDLIFEFTPVDGKATKFELRALGDALWGAGRRTE